jgi:uncharacterized membrane protein
MIEIILILGFLVRIVALNQSFWLDEATSAAAAQMSIPQILQFARGDFHPPLYYIALHFWTMIFGPSEIAIRMLSVFCGVGTIYVVYKIANELVTRQTATVAAWLTAISPLLVYYSQEARMYSQLTFLVALAVYTYLKKSWIAFSLILILVVATDYVGGLLIPVFFIHSFIKRTSLKKLFVSLLPLFIVFIFWSDVFQQQIISGLSVKSGNAVWWGILGGNSIKQVALFVVKTVSGRITFDNNIVYAASVAVPVGISVIFLTRSLYEKKLRLIWLWLAVSTVLGLLVSFIVPVFSYFRFLFVVPAFVILLAYGVNLKSKLGKVLLITFSLFQIIFVFYYIFSPQFYREDWKGFVSSLSEKHPQGTTVYFVANSQMEAFNWYSNQINPKIKASAPEMISNHSQDNIWIMRYVHDIFDPEDKLVKKVDEMGFSKFDEVNYRGVVARYYTK